MKKIILPWLLLAVASIASAQQVPQYTAPVATPSSIGAAASGANTDITSLGGLTTPLPVNEGGTGSTTASDARTALGAAASGANTDITTLAPLFVTASSTTQTTSDNSILVYAGVTSPRTYYVKNLFKTNLVLANAVPRSTGFASYYKYAPTDSDASGIQRFASLNYLETGGSQSLASTTFMASFNRVAHLGTGAASGIYGSYATSFNGHAGEQGTTGGSLTEAFGVYGAIFQQSTLGTIATQYGGYFLVENDYGASPTTTYGVRADMILGGAGGLPTSAYSFYAGTVTGTTKYSFYSSDATAPSHFAGSLDTPTVNGTTSVVTPSLVLNGTTITTAASGVAAAYKIARGATAFDGSNPTTVATGLTTVVSCTATLQLSAAITTGTAFVTHAAASGANVDFYAWILAGTASTGTETFEWICVGT